MWWERINSENWISPREMQNSLRATLSILKVSHLLWSQDWNWDNHMQNLILYWLNYNAIWTPSFLYCVYCWMWAYIRKEWDSVGWDNNVCGDPDEIGNTVPLNPDEILLPVEEVFLSKQKWSSHLQMVSITSVEVTSWLPVAGDSPPQVVLISPPTLLSAFPPLSEGINPELPEKMS